MKKLSIPSTIVLLLFAVGIKAQGIGHPILRLGASIMGPGCTCDVNVFDKSTGKSTTTTCGEPYLQIDIPYDSVEPTLNFTLYSTNSFSFFLDTAAHFIRELTFPMGTTQPWCGDQLPLQGYDQETLHSVVWFDSIPYTGDLLDTIRTNQDSSFSGMSQIQVNISASGRYYSYGADTTCNSPVTARIALELYNIAQSEVTSDITRASSFHLKVSSEMSMAFASFAPSGSPRVLDLFDALGSLNRKLYISSGQSEMDIPLETLCEGCYFARLGDEVAKFIVPPR